MDLYSEIKSHISSAKDIDYKKCYDSYKKLEQFQTNNNEIIDNYISKLKNNISNINPDNLINYIFGQFLHKKLHFNDNIEFEIRKIIETHPDVIINNYEESEDFENPHAEFGYKLSSQEEEIFDNFINIEKNNLIEQLRNFETRKKEIENEFNYFKTICSKIDHDMSTSDLDGICNKEANFKFIPKLMKNFKSFKCFRHND